MIRLHACAFFLTSLLALAAVPAAAQTLQPYPDPPREPSRLDLTGSAGWLLSTDWSNLTLLGSVSPAGVVEQILVRDLVVDPGPVYDVTVTYWEGRLGFRAHGSYANSCLAIGRSCGDISAIVQGGTVDVDSYRFDIGGAVGLIDYRPDRWVWPFVFVGIGAVTYDLDRTVGPPLSFIVRRPVPQGSVVVRDPDQVLITVDELGLETRLALNFGLGTDIRLPLGNGGLGVRLELSDYVHDSPLNLEVTDLGRFGVDRRVDFDLVHNLRASAGVVVHFGR